MEDELLALMGRYGWQGDEAKSAKQTVCAVLTQKPNLISWRILCSFVHGRSRDLLIPHRRRPEWNLQASAEGSKHNPDTTSV